MLGAVMKSSYGNSWYGTKAMIYKICLMIGSQCQHVSQNVHSSTLIYINNKHNGWWVFPQRVTPGQRSAGCYVFFWHGDTMRLRKKEVPFKSLQNGSLTILLMEEFLHQLIWNLHQYLHPRWCRISSINSMLFVLMTLIFCMTERWWSCFAICTCMQLQYIPCI